MSRSPRLERAGFLEILVRKARVGGKGLMRARENSGEGREISTWRDSGEREREGPTHGRNAAATPCLLRHRQALFAAKRLSLLRLRPLISPPAPPNFFWAAPNFSSAPNPLRLPPTSPPGPPNFSKSPATSPLQLQCAQLCTMLSSQI
jgi:hypothetical protein